jgi:hypothetical protein
MQVSINTGVNSVNGSGGGSAGGGGSFTPTSLSGCVLWLRADLGVTLNGSTVSAWADQSGNGNNASQGTAASQPTYNATTGPGGTLPGITFDGTSDMLNVNSLAAAFNGADLPFTFIVSAKMPADTVTRSVFSFGSSTVTTRNIRWRVIVSGATKNSILKTDDAVVAVMNNLNSPVTDDNTWRGIQALSSGTQAKLRNNNTMGAFAAFSNGAITLNLAAVGCSTQAAPFQYYAGALWEVIVYNRLLSDAESTQIYNYQLALGAAG